MWLAKSRLNSLTGTDTMTELIFGMMLIAVIAGALVPLFFLKTWEPIEWLLVYGIVVYLAWGLVNDSYLSYIREHSRITTCK